jgi:hypothetical protein
VAKGKKRAREANLEQVCSFCQEGNQIAVFKTCGASAGRKSVLQ